MKKDKLTIDDLIQGKDEPLQWIVATKDDGHLTMINLVNVTAIEDIGEPHRLIVNLRGDEYIKIKGDIFDIIKLINGEER